MKTKKLKIRVKTDRFSIPIPALPISLYRWISKLTLKYHPSKVGTRSSKSDENDAMRILLDSLTNQDIDHVFDQLECTEPFKMVDVQVDDEKKGKVKVEIYTI
ncbi:hypothetical protein [Methanobacterium petrolearium]|uniref:hypothetical protein n=1 Tax=Methanobacterium petrolearium TaxID=710190 RepID=UPI001AE96F18|nr:hypothetical protein [Methanobacterium petrolearium]MBP1945566.1 hypothetical protein [Methanobacterium petrolearium]BDZ71784.1 hypothetical protein GCM10025861_23010 [Methanobacterium petrolearium]